MERIALEAATTKRRRGLEEVAVVLTQGERRMQGTARAGRGISSDEAAVRATIEALGELAPSGSSASVERLTAGPVQLLQVTVRAAGTAYEGSCSMADRTVAEAAARATLDALNPSWGT